MPWLTPANASPAGFSCRVLYIPNDLEYIQAVSGALLELTYPHNWEQYGTATPDEVTALFQTMLFAYLASECAPVTPIGAIMDWMTDTPPDGWLICDGQSVSRTTYADLFALWGTAFGAGNGTTTFTLPNFQDRSPMGIGGDLLTDIGEEYGSTAVALTISNLPSHDHDFADPGHSHRVQKQSTTVNAAVNTATPAARTDNTATPHVMTDPATTGITFHAQGSNTPHLNVHPVLGVHRIVYAGA